MRLVLLLFSININKCCLMSVVSLVVPLLRPVNRDTLTKCRNDVLIQLVTL
jgi:hypothetical protein